MNEVPPSRAVAAFDSATAMLGSLAAALRGQPFPHLGSGEARAAAVRVASRLPWPLLREFYTRSGAAEALDPVRLGDVDLDAVAAWLAGRYPRRRYPAILVGASNGALTHLAAAMGVPWLPGTVLVPVKDRGDPDRPVDALTFGRRVAAPLLDRNPDVVLHQMHDQVQDRLMVSRMAYFRVKWRRLPAAYRRFVTDQAAPGAPVVLVEDRSGWPVTRIGDRHVFQVGAQGGRDPLWYARRPATPAPDDTAAEAEWGIDTGLVDDVLDWCAATGRPVVRVRYDGPQRPAHPVAVLLRRWYDRRGEDADRLVVPSFILADPWSTLAAAAVPFWTFFPVRAALRAFTEHLAAVPPYREIHILLFNHGVPSEGIAMPAQWLAAAARGSGARARLLAVRARRFPSDVGSLARYGPALAALAAAQPARLPWSPLAVDVALSELRQPGVTVTP